jgi:VWFA-related protein
MKRFAALLGIILTGAALVVCSRPAVAQTKCLSDAEVKKILDQAKAHQVAPFNEKLSEQLITLKAMNFERLQNAVAENKKPENLMKGMNQSRDKNAAELCQILKTYGWPSQSLVGQEGVESAFYLLRESSSAELQIDLWPVIVAAVKQGEILRPGFAAFVDRLRLSAGLKQLFGTQAKISDGFLILYPIEAEASVNARRKAYDLGPLGPYLRTLERNYNLPLIRSTGPLTNSFSGSLKSSIASRTTASLFEGQSVAEDEVIRVETNLVSLNVSVYSKKSRTQVSTLDQSDFAVSEDGHDESISFFATTEVPFDLVLLIDLSGSTSGKRDLIKKTTRRFIEAARPSDRLAIVTFADSPTVIAPLTDDRKKLLESVNQIEGTGGSRVWDALKFTLDQIIGQQKNSRRKAIVFMTDGVDNALGPGSAGSEISFADLLEAVRHSDALIIPIYLDTEGRDFRPSLLARMYENARNTLALLADESGGLYYKARSIEDLNGVYDQVIEDLGKVYSLGYKPTNANRDGAWRSVKIQLPKHPELLTRARSGYYAN